MRSAARHHMAIAAFGLFLFLPVAATAATTLSPPTVNGPLYGCAAALTVQGFVPGAKIDIYVNGTAHVGGGTSDSPWGQRFGVNPPLSANQVVTATQTVGSDTSLPSPPVTVSSYGEQNHGRMTTPLIEGPLYACGGAVSVRNLVNGGNLLVFANGNQIGHVNGCGEGQWLSVNPLLVAGASVVADEKLCSTTSPQSAPVVVGPTPAALPQLTVGDVYEGGKYCVVDGITNGALVETYDGSTLEDKNYYPGGGQVVRLNPPPHAGDVLTATQSLCGTTSKPSDPTTVLSCSDLPAPELAPICKGATSVHIAKAVVDAHIMIYADGVLAGNGGGPLVNLFHPAKLGENYTALQIVGSCKSPRSAALAVGCDPPQQLHEDIPNGGRAVAIAVDPSSSSNLMIASETGGLFRSTDKGVNWTHVSGSTTFGYTDVIYARPAKVIVATAGQDTRSTSGGGIWRSIDSGTTWKRMKPPFPTADCAKNAAAFTLSIEPEKNRLWAGTLCGLAYSDNAGLTWAFLPPGTGYSQDKVLAVLSPDSKRLVILTDAGVKVSKDGGTTFTHSTTGLPGSISIGVHNQIAIGRGNKDHLWWAFNYSTWDTAGKWQPHIALYRSTDYGTTWSKVITNDGWNRPPFVTSANALSGETGKYDVYFSDGACSLQRATAETGATAGLSSWTSLSFDHCDPADLAYDIDNKTPLLLASDGGLHLTSDQGAHWNLAGAGPHGYNALQITEVTGQLQPSGSKPHLYFATQDNDLWASPDGGVSWTAHRCCEGFFLNVPRPYYPASQTKVTGVSCWACGNFISDPLLSNQAGFPNPPNDDGNPRLLKPGCYIHNTKDPANPGSTFVLTKDTGATWSLSYFFPEEVRDLSKISGATDDPVIYTAVKKPGATPDGQEVLQLKRITGVLGGGAPTVSDVGGFGSLGVFATMFAWYKPFGVDPANSNYLILSDTTDTSVKVSTDGGGTWTTDARLANAVTENKTLKFYWAPFTQISTFGFDPDCKGHILAGTQQAGIITSYDSGATWGRIAGTEVIPYVSSFFFIKPGEVIASSYGRGLWRLSYSCVRKTRRPFKLAKLGEPFLYWKGARTPLDQLNPPEKCENCAFFLVAGGRIVDYTVDPRTDQLTAVVIDRGRLIGYTPDGREVKAPFRVIRAGRPGTFSGDRQMTGMLSDKLQVRGVYLDGKVMKGALLSSRDIAVGQLPKKKPLGPHLRVESGESGREAPGAKPVTVRGVGFDRKFPLEVTLDGKPLPAGGGAVWEENGTFRLSITPAVGIGGHTILVRQKTDSGVVQDATTFIITVSDTEKR